MFQPKQIFHCFLKDWCWKGNVDIQNVYFLQIDQGYPRVTRVEWYGCTPSLDMQDGSEMNHDISDAENYSDSDPMDIEVINPFQGK